MRVLLTLLAVGALVVVLDAAPLAPVLPRLAAKPGLLVLAAGGYTVAFWLRAVALRHSAEPGLREVNSRRVVEVRTAGRDFNGTARLAAGRKELRHARDRQLSLQRRVECREQRR